MYICSARNIYIYLCPQIYGVAHTPCYQFVLHNFVTTKRKLGKYLIYGVFRTEAGWNRKVGRLRLRRDRFGPGICNGAMRSETLQFCICAVRVCYSDYVMSLNFFAINIVVIGAVHNVRRYSDYVLSLFVVYVHVHICMHVNVTYN